MKKLSRAKQKNRNEEEQPPSSRPSWNRFLLLLLILTTRTTVTIGFVKESNFDSDYYKNYLSSATIFSTDTKITKSSSSPPSSTLPECNDPCLWLAGINGSWVQDWDYARDYGQYPIPSVFQPGPYFFRTLGNFQPSPDSPFPYRTSFKWVDHSSCPVEILTVSSFCRVLSELQIQRILFLSLIHI